MKEKQKGGPRKGAGRKPSANPKEPITVFVETKTVQSYGGKDGIRAAIYDFLSKDDSPALTPEARKEIKTIKIKDLTKPTTDLKPHEQPRTNYSANTIPPIVDAQIEAQIAELEKELKSPPKNPLIGEKAWKKVREQKIQELRNQLNGI